MNSDFKDLLSIFSEAGVRYLVVGGQAAILYTEPRFTKDFDLWVDAAPSNAQRVFEALARFGAPLGQCRPEDFAVPGSVFMMGVPPTRIDVLTSIEGVEFADAWPRRTEVEVDGLRVSFIGREDLIRNKRAVGRRQDLIDVDRLEGRMDD